MAAFAETVSGYDSHTEASENSSVGTDVDEGIDPREELYLNESFCRVIFFHNKTSTIHHSSVWQRDHLWPQGPPH